MAAISSSRAPAKSRAQASRQKALVTAPAKNGLRVVKSVTVFEKADPLYAFWRDLKNIERVVQYPVTITVLSDLESEWTAELPFGWGRTTWKARITSDEPGKIIAWESRADDTVTNRGSVRFERAPGSAGTEVTVELEYHPPGGKLSGLLAKLSPDEPGHQAKEALRRFKALIEAGEIPTTTGQPVGEPQKSKKKKT